MVNASSIVTAGSRGYVRFDKPLVQSFSGAKGVDQLNAMGTDAVTELLAALKVTSSVYCLSEFLAPWGFRVDGQPVAKFHLVLDGTCWLRIDGADPVRLGPGELVILPRGDGHSVSDDIATPVRDLDRIVADHPLDADARLFYGGKGHRTRLLCGGFVLAEAMPARLLAVIPTIMQIDAGLSGVGTWLEPTFALLRHEAEHAAPGAQAIFAKLADVFLAQALREFLAGAGRAGLLPVAPSPDAPIEKAVALVQDCPSRRWTLPELANAVGMSRTAFATRFRAAIGESPMRYLTKLRLAHAAGYLTTTDLSVHAIAGRTGYDSDAALSKAFKREFGVTPGAFRHGRTTITVTPHCAP
jgi:AraC-like DNA-binding protein